MNKKRMAAYVVAATMLLNVTPVMAQSTTVTNATGSSTVTGSGNVDGADVSDVFSVTLPTSVALDFDVDPYGLLNVASGTAVDADNLPSTGVITSASGSAAMIKNESSVPVSVDVQLQAIASGNATFVTGGSVVASGSSTNLFLSLVPSTQKAWVEADGVKNYNASSHVIPVTQTQSQAKFQLQKADYEIVKGSSNTFQIVSKAGNYDSTVFKVGGIVNSKAEWKDFISGSSTVGMTAVFTFAKSPDTDVLDDTIDVYGLVSGSATNFTDDTGSAGGAYTATFVEGQDITFTGLANADALRVVYLSGAECDKPMAAGQFTYNKTEGVLTLPSAFLMGPKNNGDSVVKFKLIFNASENRDDVIITINY